MVHGLFQRSRKDWDFLLSNGMLPLEIHTKKRRDDSSIETALKFIFQSQNIQMLSWGTKRIKVGDEWLRFPALMRRKTAEKMYRDYLSFMSSSPHASSDTHTLTSKPLSRSIFLQIVQCLTRGQLNRKAAVDYVLGTLLYDNIRTLRDIVCFEVESQDDRKLHLSQLEAVEEYLKFTMLEHISSDKDPLHDPGFALDESPLQREKVKSTCTTCMSPFQVVDNIRRNINPGHDDIRDVLRDASEKMLLYMGHQHRCKNQEKRISEIFAELKEDYSVSKVVVLLDYKMKFEAILYQEKNTEFYGKKGISWNGAAIFYCRAEESGTRNGENGAATPPATKTRTIETLFFDHVSSNDMTQDCIAVASILDAILARLHLELPTVSQLYILSENARCYQNDILPVIAPFIAKQHDLFLSGVVHTETQRGKSLLDAHFAIAMMHVNSYCRETRRDVTTPGDIVTALNNFGGVANCTAEMVHISRDNEGLRKWVVAKQEKKLVPLGRVNEILYSPLQNDEFKATCFKLSGRKGIEFIFKKYCSTRESDRTEDNVNTSNEYLDDNEDDTIGDTTTSLMEGMTTDGTQEDNIINHRRPSEVAYQGLVTGVLVWSRSRLRKQRKRRKDSSRCGDEIENQTEILDEDFVVMKDTVAERTEDEMEEDIQPVLQECPKCKKGYRRSDFLQKHIQHCNGGPVSMQILDRACRMAMQMLHDSELSIYTTRTRHPAALTITVTPEISELYSQRSGWAQRPTYGKTLGNNTVHKHAGDIAEMFSAGEREKGKKMSASIMRDVLRKKYASRYDIPSEYFITSFISSLVRKKKKAGKDCNELLGGGGMIRKRMTTIYVERLRHLLVQDENLMPRMAMNALINASGLSGQTLPNDFPSEKAIKAKVSQLRSQMRKASVQSNR